MNVSWLTKMVNVFGQQFISLGKSKVSILGYAQFFISNYVKYLNCFFFSLFKFPFFIHMVFSFNCFFCLSCSRSVL